MLFEGLDERSLTRYWSKSEVLKPWTKTRCLNIELATSNVHDQ